MYIHEFYCAKCNPQRKDTQVRKEAIYRIWSELRFQNVRTTRIYPEVVDNTNNAREVFLGWPQHFQHDIESKCQRYLRYIGLAAEVRADPREKTKMLYQQTLATVRSYASRCKVVDGKRAICCVMYDIQTGKKFSGRCGWKKEQGQIPGNIWNSIPDDVNPDFYAFGKNCAEVECVSKAYASRSSQQRKNGIVGCIFVAWDIPRGKIKPPCTTCNRWLPKHGAITK